MEETALIYCENEFGKADGKVANGLVRHSEKYKIVGIIDSTSKKIKFKVRTQFIFWDEFLNLLKF